MNVTTNSKTHSSALWRKSGPDFLCIGLPKAGTRWLYDLLQFEPGFWMPPFKALSFFSAPLRFERRVRKFHRETTKGFKWASWKRQKQHKRALDARDKRFLKHAITYNKNKASIEWYKELFAPKGDLVSGDITPDFSRLNSSRIERIARDLPDLRIILLLRDPVSRAWSAFNMHKRREIIDGIGKPSAGSLSAFYQPPPIEEIAKLVKRGATRRCSFPAKIYNNWCQHFGASQVKCLFFDDILKAPSNVRKDILEFFDLPNTTPSADRMGLDFNRKSNLPKPEMNDEVKAFLVEVFRDELFQCAETFGGAAEDWPKRYGID